MTIRVQTRSPIHRAAGTAVRAVAALLFALPAFALTEGAPAPAFKLPARGGQEIALDQYKGQVVMINFWATWCGPCRQEMPLLESLHQKYRKAGFTLIGVNVEPDSKAAEEWLQKQKTPVSFPILFDTESKVSALYGVEGMPSSIIIDRQGKVRVIHQGFRPGDENHYLDYVRALLRE